MTEFQQVPQHPLERMQNMAERVTLPGSGIEVVIRRADVELINMNAMKYALSLDAMQEVATNYAKEVQEATSDGQPLRKQMPFSPSQMLEMTAELNRSVFRAVIAAPKLDDLIEMYGGSDELPDLGMGSDYSYLKEQIDRLNPSPEKQEQDKSAGVGVSAPGGSEAVKSGGKVRKSAQ